MAVHEGDFCKEMLGESHLACCLCKQMADKQKIMNGWMDRRRDNLSQHQHKCRHISKEITTNVTIIVAQSKYSHSFTKFVHQGGNEKGKKAKIFLNKKFPIV